MGTIFIRIILFGALVFQLMATVQLSSNKRFAKQMELHTATQNNDVILLLELKKHLSNESRKMTL